jgi:ABC-2 type transport system permease protein
MSLINEIYYLIVRDVNVRFKRPATFLPSLFISAFFFIAFGYAFQSFTTLPGFPTTNYIAFLTPFILLQSMVFSSGDAGFGILTDILSGYFDKLMLTPINRFSVLFSSLFAASLRALIQSLLIIGLAIGLGVTFVTGIPGILAVIWFAVTFGVAWSCIGFAIALWTKNAEATQSYFVLFFPAVFLTTGFVPLELLPSWFQTIALINPVTYVMNATRAIVVEGWDSSVILGLVVLVGFTAVLMAATTWIFRKATA